MAGIDTISGGNIEPRGLEEEMRSSYLDYAMSVIVGRALPDVRDGLKPVHRRVLFSMSENGLQPNRPYAKSARIVGDVMGKYHPHGDSAIYDTLVRMAQDFSMRNMLVDGQGNFGSLDDDPAAAMRYTEARLAPIAREMLRDLDADTVNFVPNYDGQNQEPVVLPARFPNLLVNGSSGIAVGMATNIPPHNLRETILATIAYIDDPDIDTVGLMQHLKGPDFPTGGVILGLTGIKEAYETGRGRIRVRAKAHIEEGKQGKDLIIVTELPYMVKKGGDSGLIKKIADLHAEKKLSEITNIEDHSDRRGMRVVIELKRDANPKVVLNKLYKHTQLQTTFGVNMVALVDNVPRTLPLRSVIHNYVQHQREVIVRRSKHELRTLEARVHRLEGLLIALDHLDAVIALIRGSRDRDVARAGLMETYGLTHIQAQAILDLRLQQLTALEADSIKREHADLVERIRELRELLGDEDKVLSLIKEELEEIAERYGDDRRTVIAPSEDDIDIEDLIADQQMVIAISNSGYIKSLPLATYRQQRRGGVGITGMDLKEDDYIEHLFVSSTHDYLLFFTNRGKVYRSKVYDLPEAGRTSKGRHLSNILPLRDGRARAVRAGDARLLRDPVPDVRHPPGHGEEDRVPGLQHADQGRRHHRHQDPRRRRAGRRAAGRPRRRDPHRLPRGPDRALQRGGRARDGPRHERRARHQRLRQGQLRAGDGRRAAGPGPAGRHRGRLRQADRRRGVPPDLARRQGRQDDLLHRGQGPAGRGAGRARARGPRLHLAERHRPADRRARHQPLRPRLAGRAGDEAARGRRGVGGGAGGRVRGRRERRRRGSRGRPPTTASSRSRPRPSRSPARTTTSSETRATPVVPVLRIRYSPPTRERGWSEVE